MLSKGNRQKKPRVWISCWTIRDLMVFACAAVFLGLCVFGILARFGNAREISYYREDNIDHNAARQTSVGGNQRARLALVIDDFGSSRDGVEEMLALDIPFTAAVMPFLDYSVSDAQMAYALGKEVIVHLPMQAHEKDNPAWLGPNPIRITSDTETVRGIVADAMKGIPHAVGANVHMGTECSENPDIVAAVMETLKQEDYFFVDSLTTPNSVCEAVASDMQMRFAERNVFLEAGNKDKQFAVEQLRRAGKIALEHSYALVIGHVGPEGGQTTAAAIAEVKDELIAQGIEFVYVSQIISIP